MIVSPVCRLETVSRQKNLTLNYNVHANVLPWTSTNIPQNLMSLGYSLNPLTPTVKPCVIQSFLSFDSMERTPKMSPLIGKLLSSTLL